MEKIFKPNRRVLAYSALSMYVLVGGMFIIGLFSGTSYHSLIKVFVIMFGSLTILILLFFRAKVVISQDIILVITLLKASSTISSIISINHRSTFLGGVDILEVHYPGKLGSDRTMRISVNAYGPRQVKEMLTILHKENPLIHFDHKAAKLLDEI